MADPVTLAVIGATAGAMVTPDDPLKGALIGGTLGYGGATLAAGGAASGATAAAAGDAAAATTAAATSGGAATAVPGSFGAELAAQNIIPQATQIGGQNLLQTASSPYLGATTGAFDMYGMADPASGFTQQAMFASPQTGTSALAGKAPLSETQRAMATRMMMNSAAQPQQNAVSQGGMMRPGQAVNVVEPVASLLEPLRNRRPRPAFSLL
jgi:hypothetical protein